MFLIDLRLLAIAEATPASDWVPSAERPGDLDARRPTLALTEELLRVAGFLATFAGLSFTVYLVTDPTYPDEFRTDMASEMREAIAVRAAYRYNWSGLCAGPIV